MPMKLGNKVCTAEQAIALIQSGQTFATSGFVGAAHPEALTAALEKRFLATGEPRNLTLAFAAGQGDGKTRGLNHLAHEGLLRRVIGGHWNLAPRLGKLAVEGKIEAYNFPQGVLSQLFREIAAGRPGLITGVGLGTFIDPNEQGGRLNEMTPRDLVQRIELDGKTWLWYRSFPVHIGLIRATAADPLGNLIMDREVIIGEVLPIAQAVHNSGGIVIAQVEKILDYPAHPQQVRVPGMLVDHLVVADRAEHHQTFAEEFNASYVSPAPSLTSAAAALAPMPNDERRMIAARAADELREGMIVNLGIGMPEGVARIAAERGLIQQLLLTVESGPIGGVPAGGLSFGASAHPQAIVDQPSQFDFYDGRGLDLTALGLAQLDAQGNVNVSKFGSRVAGVGGFVNISQSARTVIFCGTFTAGDLQVTIDPGKLRIVKEGPIAKFVPRVEQVSFSAARSRELGQRVFYVTERAVFQLTEKGVELIEVAPGIDVQTQVLALMPFAPIVRHVRPMPLHVSSAPAVRVGSML